MGFSFPSFLRKKSESVLGIDIGSSAIKMVQVRKEKGVAILETYGSLALGPYVEGAEVGQYTNPNEEVLHTVLSVLATEAKVTAKKVGVAIPFQSSLISLIDVPALSDERIAQLIPFEARRHIPVSLEDVSIDWFIVPQALLERSEISIFEEDDAAQKVPEVQKKRKVLLIAIHNHELVKHRNIIQNTNFTSKFFEIEIFSSLRSAVYKSGIPIVLIDIGARTTKFYVVEHGIILQSYFINQGGQTITNAIAQTEKISFTDAERRKRNAGFTIKNPHTREAMLLVIDEIFAEANNMIVSYEQRYHKSISRIILTGGGSSMKNLLEVAKRKIQIGVEIAHPFSRLQHPEVLSHTLEENGPEFAVAVGAALRAVGE